MKLPIIAIFFKDRGGSRKFRKGGPEPHFFGKGDGKCLLNVHFSVFPINLCKILQRREAAVPPAPPLNPHMNEINKSLS